MQRLTQSATGAGGTHAARRAIRTGDLGDHLRRPLVSRSRSLTPRHPAPDALKQHRAGAPSHHRRAQHRHVPSQPRPLNRRRAGRPGGIPRAPRGRAPSRAGARGRAYYIIYIIWIGLVLLLFYVKWKSSIAAADPPRTPYARGTIYSILALLYPARIRPGRRVGVVRVLMILISSDGVLSLESVC